MTLIPVIPPAEALRQARDRVALARVVTGHTVAYEIYVDSHVIPVTGRGYSEAHSVYARYVAEIALQIQYPDIAPRAFSDVVAEAVASGLKNSLEIHRMATHLLLARDAVGLEIPRKN